jgi:enoyl-CoA hydratase/carnithine racemase
MQQITYAVDDGVAVITLNRPDVLNAWTAVMASELATALADADADVEVGVVVITGAGRAFCAGLDLSSQPSFDADDRPEPTLLPHSTSKPVVAAINGHAIGVGITLALTADVRFAAATAKIAFPFVRLGLVSELGSHALLPAVVGLSTAADLLLSGRTISGDEAQALGLVSRSLPADEVLPAAVAWARDVAHSTDRDAVATSKRLLWSGLLERSTTVVAAEIEELGRLGRLLRRDP